MKDKADWTQRDFRTYELGKVAILKDLLIYCNRGSSAREYALYAETIAHRMRIHPSYCHLDTVPATKISEHMLLEETFTSAELFDFLVLVVKDYRVRILAYQKELKNYQKNSQLWIDLA